MFVPCKLKIFMKVISYKFQRTSRVVFDIQSAKNKKKFNAEVFLLVFESYLIKYFL